MPMRFFNTMLTNASRNAAMGILSLGLLIGGLGLMIILLPTIFVAIAAGLFFVVAFGFISTAVKMLWSLRSGNHRGDQTTYYRKNVKIHYKENHNSDSDFI